jgi:hypothetical protein
MCFAGIPVLKEEYVHACIAAGKVLSDAKFRF